MAKFFLENFGCRATDADTAALRHSLLGEGLQPCADAAAADIVVLNTCTVTAAADSQGREAIRKIHRSNSSATIIVTGCYAQRAPEEIAALEGVTWVVGNARQHEIPGLARRHSADGFVPLAELESAGMSLARGPAKILTGDIFEQSTIDLAGAPTGHDGGHVVGKRTRPILKVQDGCNNRCAYCVIPFVRGRSRSLPPDAVVSEARRLAAGGAKEIVLSGINLGSYGRDLAPRAALATVVRRILDETPVEHVRFSSIEPQDVTEDFVGMVAGSDRLAPHFHVPLQSGSDRILRAMHRWYRAELYAQRIELIRRKLPAAAIGADVIVGFPGETREEFGETLRFIEALPLTYLHVFSFSARPGTKAESLGNAVPHEAIRERARELRALSAAKSAAFRQSQAGKPVRALTLARGGENWTEALTRNYLKVRIAGRIAANNWRRLVLTGNQHELCAEQRDAIPTESVLEDDLRQRQVAAVGD
ncbi:MAG TPA: tRNA (N(6)-L-threonylcarbamoyladenosine(37)-C(2))-methylthiotransferase MtaB [Candidatus Acidoferrales bacterium]|jgi:threonylcarbamoyladenosine tRNA methylthiotransferase MtaB|nr:tRNA (N(6)-L-threonylcarbamoyladenosine(37)-C(2))-methylthiotransferase MtaB [Candidatus Acidoferrales bacterium]